MKKRWIAILLCISMLSGTLLTGCTGQTATTNEAVQESVDASETEEGAEAVDEAIAESPMIQANAGELNVIDDKYRTF